MLLPPHGDPADRLAVVANTNRPDAVVLQFHLAEQQFTDTDAAVRALQQIYFGIAEASHTKHTLSASAEMLDDAHSQ